ncbi:MAG TPA: hypothetical protein VN611_04285 [Patescibacteria group bacterium]|nr:hypothetical protein [Patescibacteria group bacterium]
MKLGIIGPLEPVNKISQLIKREFHQIEPFPILYKKAYAEAVPLIAEHQSFLDVLMFAGASPLFYARKHVKQTVPWEFIPRSVSSLLRVLLEIQLTGRYDIRRLSSDLYESSQLYEAYEEVGIPRDILQIYITDHTPHAEDYLDHVCAFHEQHYFQHRTTCCLTALSSVYEKLSGNGIPCFRVDPTTDVVRQTLNKIQLNHLLQVSQQSQIVALLVCIDSSHEYALINDNEYQYIIDKTNVAREIYLFAQRIQAAVAEVGPREFLLFSTKQLLESVTSNYEEISLLQSVKKHTSRTVSIGVGYGKTAQEAKNNASLGMARAEKSGGDRAFIIYSGGKFIGPLQSAPATPLEETKRKIDGRFLAVSEKAGVSVNTIFQLCSIITQQEKNRFTPAELAQLSGVTLRTVNRVITKLTAHGFCFEVGKRVFAKAGRPSRIVELRLP